ncbi:MAG: ROK family protein [Victivallaceae bacterium]
MLELNNQSCYAVGIDLGDDYLIRGVLCDLCGNVINREELEYENNFETILSVLCELIKRLVSVVPKKRVKGVGIAVSGTVDSNANEIVSSTTFDVEKKSLAKLLAKRCGFKVFVENRPNAAALAETMFGAGKDFNNLVYITSGRGVGAGIVIDGKIFRGSFGIAGEIGEMLLPFVDENGEFRQMQLEEETRARAVLSKVEKLKGQKLSFRQILEAYQQDDADVVAVMDRNAQYMAYAAQLVANLLNPEAIILGGRTVELGDKYFIQFKNYFDQGLFKGRIANKATEVRYSEFGRMGVAVGGAVVVLDMVMNLDV